jgi:hypothetical protein
MVVEIEIKSSNFKYRINGEISPNVSSCFTLLKMFASSQHSRLFSGASVRHDRKSRQARGLEQDVFVPVLPGPFLKSW